VRVGYCDSAGVCGLFIRISGRQRQHVGCDDASSQEGDAMARGDRRKCKCCRKLFRPDPRNRRHQRYCSTPACRRASKAASQARWLAKPENQDYFRDPVHVARVKAWRLRHRRYWQCKPRCSGRALQEVSMVQVIGSSGETANFVPPPLQEVISATRGHIGATCCSDWLNRSSRGDTVTR
jgi:hypothetical protein